MMRLVSIILGILFLLAVVLGGAFLWDAYFVRPSPNAPFVDVTIREGSSVNTIASTLIDRRILNHAFFFKLFVRWQDATQRLQAGTFPLKSNMSFSNIVAILSNAKDVEVQMTIPEGYTAKQMLETLRASLKGVDETEWKQLTAQAKEIAGHEFLATIPVGQGLEGYLFPDTYRFREDANAKTVIETMLFTFSKRFAENSIVIPSTLVFENGMTLHEVITLASIVEREVQTPEDMKIVAGIFRTRLKIGMALQADSTVNYVTGKTTSAISIEDANIHSPYNTYRNLGLPPGPISNPGMNAILAVLQPTDSEHLYFLTTEDRRVIYAKTFAEHILNKQKFLR
jgi:UPF0755 protein